jgi:hypothetical protein
MPSVQSIDHQKRATVFRSVEQTHLQAVLPDVEDVLREVLTAEETLPDLALLVALLGRVHAGGTRQLIGADNAHDEELANDVEARLHRDQTGGRVHNRLVEVRRIAAGLFGPELSARVVGAPSQTPSVGETERLWRQAEDAVKRLEDPELIVPATTTASLQFDPAQLASELRADNEAFRAALDAMALEQRKAEASLKVKNAQVDEAKRIEAACQRIYEGFFLLAGRADLADRFRRALRTRRGASSADDAAPAPDAGATPDDAPAPDGAPQDGEPPKGGEPLSAPASDD